METPERILVRFPNWVGDVVMATPALRALRVAHPAAQIHVEVRPYLRGLVEGLAGVAGVIEDPRKLTERRRRLRAQRFDWAVILPDSVSSALGPFLARIPLRIGAARDIARRLLLTHPLPYPAVDGRRVPVSMIDRYLRVTRALGCPDAGDALEVPVGDDARAAVSAQLARVGIDPHAPLQVAIPGASFGASKLWPPEHYAVACDRLHDARGFHTVLAPGPGEIAIAHAVVQHMRTPVRVIEDPGTTLPELAALVERARLVITNDTGPRHIAVALGVPTVVVMGPTDPRHTHHLLERQRVLREDVECSPCGLKVCPIDHRCMTRLLPERVVAAAEELLA